MSRGALCAPLLRPAAVNTIFGAVPYGLFAAAQALAERCTRRARRAGAGHPSQRVAPTTLLQSLATLGREIAKSLAILKKLTPLGTRHVMPAAVEGLPAAAGVAIDVAVPARVDVAASAFANEALTHRFVPAERRAAGRIGPRRHPRPIGTTRDPNRLPGPVDIAPTCKESGSVRARIVGSDKTG